MKELWLSISNKLKAAYVLWLTFHFILLVLGDDSNYSKNRFWPLDGLKASYYDSSEFLIYILVPLLLYTAYWFYIKDIENDFFLVLKDKLREYKSEIKSKSLKENNDTEPIGNLNEKQEKIEKSEVEYECSACKVEVKEEDEICPNCGVILNEEIEKHEEIEEHEEQLSNKKITNLRFFLIVFLMVLSSIYQSLLPSQVPRDLYMYDFIIGAFALFTLVGLLPAVIAIIRKIIKKKPTILIYILYFGISSILFFLLFFSLISSKSY